MGNPKFNGATRAYYRFSKSWYAKEGEVVEVAVGLYHEGGGCSGEFTFAWEVLAGKPTPVLRAYDDGWAALMEFQDLLQSMAELDGMDTSEEEFCKVLDSLGIEDWTRYPRNIP